MQPLSNEEILKRRDELAKQGKLLTPDGKGVETQIKVNNLQGKEGGFIVNARDCVDESHLHYNIAENIKLIDKFLDEFLLVNKDKAIIASAGPSLKKHLDYIKKEQKKGVTVVCVKHSLPVLVEAGIDPDACVILDPRDVQGTSTHNIVRSTLFDTFNKDKTTFYIASMTDPSVTKLLKSKGAKIVGWHAAVADINKFFAYFVKFAIAGGSCSAMRAISLFSFLGFREMELIGFDCSFDETPKDITKQLHDGRPKYMTVSANGKNFITTGELVALAQDIERFLADGRNDITLSMREGGLGYELFNIHHKPNKTYKQLIPEIVEKNN